MKNISKFSEVDDYLPILNGVIATDLIVILLLLTGFINSKVLRSWYRDCQLSAVIADVLVIVLVIILTRFLYPFIFSEFSLFYFILLSVFIQIIHDILFYYFTITIPRGISKILDIFKDYGKEMGIRAIFADSLMMISSIIIATYFKNMSINYNIIILIFLIYLIPYFIFSV